uniref:Uncharacterized protein n=1 Tax=Anguilla anguilla TaxID=7936 RepID=A0A0E9RE73_ANGAN
MVTADTNCQIIGLYKRSRVQA